MSTGRAPGRTGSGLNGLYINLQGREMSGAVAPADRERLMEEIAAKLLATIDPKTGERAVTKVYRREQVYSDAGYFDRAPDLVVGYAKGTRGSDQSAPAAFRPRSSSTTPMRGAAITAWITRRCPGCCCPIGRCANRRPRSTSWRPRSSRSSVSKSFRCGS